MRKQWVWVWQPGYGADVEVNTETSDDYTFDGIVKLVEDTVRFQGGTINLYEVNNDGKLYYLATWHRD